MLKFFARMPPWLVTTLLLATGAVFSVVLVLLPGLHGWRAWVGAAITTVVVTLIVVLPLLAQYQAKQESRLRVSVQPDSADKAIPAYVSTHAIIDSLVSAEEAACLASLPEPKPPLPLRFRSDQADEGGRKGFIARSLDDMSMASYQELLKAHEAGEELTAEQEEALEAAKEAMAQFQTAFKNVFASQKWMMGTENRSKGQYRAEVSQYITAYRQHLGDRLHWSYVRSNLAQLTLTLSNPTERVFQDVRVEIHIPGPVNTFDPRDADRPAAPARPRKFGTAPASPLFGGLTDIISRPSYLARALVPAVKRPVIDNSGSTRVTYPPVTLRPLESGVRLPKLAVVVREEAGSVIVGTWTATALNAEGVSEGKFQLTVSETPLPIGALLSGENPDDE